MGQSIAVLLQCAAAMKEQGALDTAFELYSRAAEEGSAEAEFELGLLWEEAACDFMEDCDEFETYPKAEEHYMNAAHKGHSKAALALAKLYFSSYYSPNQFQEAVHWYERAAELGEQEAVEYLAAHEEAVRTRQAAEAGDPEAMVKAAQLLFEGKYLKRGEREGLDYLRMAAKADYLPAVEAIAERLYCRRYFKEAAEWFERALALGNDKVIIKLAGLYADDFGAGRNAERAKALYLLALEGEKRTEALWGLGYLYSNDPDLYDTEVALRYLREYEALTGNRPHRIDEIENIAALSERAEQGDADAAFKLGEAYEYEGRGVPRDYFCKRKWYERAAELGHEQAMEKAADSYYYGKDGNGKDETVDLKKAAFWYEQAAMHRHKFAVHRLALMYYKGEGVERNLKKAILWMALLQDDFYLGSSAKQLVEKWKKELGE